MCISKKETSDVKLTSEYVRTLLYYDPETGMLTWKYRDPKTMKGGRDKGNWNDQFAGKEAFTYRMKSGYLQGAINRKALYAHRVAWLIHYGEWPEEQVDHINGYRDDNRIVNLRLANDQLNRMNQRTPKTNSSGRVGISFSKQSGKWHAYIGNKNSRINLGLFASFDDAVAARDSAEKKLKYHKNHGRKTHDHYPC